VEVAVAFQFSGERVCPVAFGGRQRWLTQLVDWQSAPVLHAASTSHFLGQLTPQSTLGSLPFCTLSLHVGRAQSCVFGHTPLAQSAATLHFSVSAQGSQAPPQSTSVSSWLSTPSSQAAGWHVPLAQATPSQSSVLLQA